MFDMANYFYSESLIGTTKVCMYVRNLFFLKFEETTPVKAICGLTDFYSQRVNDKVLVHVNDHTQMP